MQQRQLRLRRMGGLLLTGFVHARMRQPQPRPDRDAVATHHAVRGLGPLGRQLPESDAHTEQVADVQQRELRLLGQLGRLVRELCSLELQQRLHEPVALSRADGHAVAEHHAVPRLGPLGRHLSEPDAHTEQVADVHAVARFRARWPLQ